MLTLTEVKARAATSHRVMIKPKVAVQVKNEQQRNQVAEVVQRVMNEHYDVLLALKSR